MSEEDIIESGAADEAPTPEDVVPEVRADKPPGRLERRRRWRRALRLGRWTLFLSVVLGVLLLTQTDRGQGLVLEELLERIGGSLAGELTVEGIRSQSLFFGFTLEGVALTAGGGRRFLTADSVVVRYWPHSLAFGSPRVRSTTLFGPNAEISRYPGEDFLNVNRLVPASAPEDSVPTPPITLGLGRIAVRGGTLEILLPAEGDSQTPTVPAPDGGRFRRMAIEDLDLDIEQTIFRSDGPVMVDARLTALSATVAVLQEPFVIRAAEGDLSFGDRGLRIADGAYRLRGSFIEGEIGFGPERPGDPWTFLAGMRSEEWGDLADLAWVDPRIPSGRFRGQAEVRIEDGVDLRLTGVELETSGSSVTLDGNAAFGDVLSVRALRVTASPLRLSTIEPLLGRDLPYSGALRGSATLGGTLQDLTATGRMTFTPDDLPGALATADFSGTVHTGANPGGTALQLRLDPFDYRLLEPYLADAVRLGTGRATVSIEGRVDGGLLVVADVTHQSDATTTSRAVGRGVVRRDGTGEWALEVSAELAPLSLPLLGRLWPQVDLPGALRGPVQFEGPLTDVHASGDLTSEAGRVVFDARADLTALAATGYRVEAYVDALDLSAFATAVPSPSVFTGQITFDGSGLTLESLEGSGTVALRSGRIGGLAVDSVDAALQIQGGLLSADSLHASVAGILLDGAGSIGLTEGQDGAARFAFSAETLLGLRPVFMGDSILVGDTLNPLEQDALRARGIDPDTLPSAMDVRMAGAVQGTADVQGWIGALNLSLLFDLAGGAYGHNSVDSAHVTLVATGLPETLGDWVVDLGANGVVFADRVFAQVDFDGTMLQRRGAGTLDIVRTQTESYFLTGAFALDSLGGELQLTDAVLDVSDRSWVLSHPTNLTWQASTLSIDSLEIRRTDEEDPMLVRASGTLTRGGNSDFRVTMQGFHVEQALRVAQLERIDLSGHIDLDLEVVGPAERPVINATFHVEDPRYGNFGLTRLEGSLEYRELHAAFLLDAWDEERRVVSGEGIVPVNLALSEVQGRAVEQNMDVSLRVDSLDAAVALVYLSALEDVAGTVSAQIHIGGTPSRPEPSGTVTLADAAWTVDALGVRHTGVSGELLLQRNRTVGIKLASIGSSAGSGTSTVSGIVRLEPEVTNPTLDLTINFDRFLAVDRRDMLSTISTEGEALRLTGTYRLPVLRGDVRVEEATLFVEEFARSVGIVDLRSPLLYAPGMAVDTTVFITQPLIAGLSNPFLDNLRVNIDLAVPRNLWLRSGDMNVEMGGDLIVAYDRGQGDLVLVGELEALRGTYIVLGRTFEVDGGTASFLGQPGINPTLAIEAFSRVRRREGERLEVRATVEGTLVEPLVTLSTEEAGLSQSDLISYLVLGQSSGEAGGIGQNLTAGGITLATGALVNQLGTALAAEIPFVNRLDYLAFSQQSDALGADGRSGLGAYTGNVVGGTQVELGKYLNEDVFVIFVLGGENVAGDGQGASVTFRGVRMELALLESLFLEVFMEDQFLRSGSGGLGVSGLDGGKQVGLLMFGEWGYGSPQQ